MYKAFCYRSGLIGFCEDTPIPEGALGLVAGRKKEVRKIIDVTARHSRHTPAGQDEPQLLVPGIPEADNDEAAFQALQDFVSWIKPRGNNRPLVFGGDVK